MGIFPSLDPFEGIRNRPMSLNGYLYVYGDPINNTDASGMCPLLDETGIGYQVDARHCNELVNRLHSWNINVVWDESSIPPLSCIPETVRDTANQAQGIKQRWTTNEVRAIYNAFRIFNKAHEIFLFFSNASSQYGVSFPYDYVWPRPQAITFEKQQYISENDQTSFGIHFYNDDRIILSGLRWGEANPNMTMQSRSWLVLHEFSHFFTKDRVQSVRPDYLYAIDIEYANQVLELFEGSENLQGSPTQYSTRGAPGSALDFGEEYLTEAVTGTLWNYGYNNVSGYDSGAGGWTGVIRNPNTIVVNNIEFTLKNVRDIRGLEGWIFQNIIAPS